MSIKSTDRDLINAAIAAGNAPHQPGGGVKGGRGLILSIPVAQVVVVQVVVVRVVVV